MGHYSRRSLLAPHCGQRSQGKSSTWPTYPQAGQRILVKAAEQWGQAVSDLATGASQWPQK